MLECINHLRSLMTDEEQKEHEHSKEIKSKNNTHHMYHRCWLADYARWPWAHRHREHRRLSNTRPKCHQLLWQRQIDRCVVAAHCSRWTNASSSISTTPTSLLWEDLPTPARRYMLLAKEDDPHKTSRVSRCSVQLLCYVDWKAFCIFRHRM